jgi:hypothetical protein
MLSITKLFTALGTLAESILTLAATVNEANSALRQRLALDALADEVPALDHQAENGIGRRGKRQTA